MRPRPPPARSPPALRSPCWPTSPSTARSTSGRRSDSRNYKLDAYAGFSRGGFWIDGDFGYSFDEYPSITRRTGFEFLPLARGDTRGHTWSFGATPGYDAPLGPVTLGPYLNG